MNQALKGSAYGTPHCYTTCYTLRACRPCPFYHTFLPARSLPRMPATVFSPLPAPPATSCLVLPHYLLLPLNTIL